MPDLQLAHPGSDQLQAFSRGRLDDEQTSAAISAHLETCEVCRRTLANIAGDTLEGLVRSVGAAGAGHETTTNAGSQTAAPDADAPDISFLLPPSQPGDLGRLAGHRVLRLLGSGGMGIVFEAEDERLERRVALKVMKPEIAKNPRQRERFLREARAAAKVEHDNICPIYQIGEEHGVPFLAMPFLKGQSLDSRLKRGEPAASATGPLPIAEVVRIGREIAQGLAAAHDAGLVHRDIKPGNIWLEERVQGLGFRVQEVEKRVQGSGFGLQEALNPEPRTPNPPAPPARVKILDFGLARLRDEQGQLTQSGAILGTPAYMAPEQAQWRVG